MQASRPVPLADEAAAIRYADALFPRRLLWAPILASILLTALLMTEAGQRMDPFAPGNAPFYLFAGLAVAAQALRRPPPARWRRAVADTAEYFATFTLLALLGTVASYPVVANTSHGMADAALASVDAALGFDWTAWYRLVCAHPSLQIAERLAYQSIYWTPVAILVHAAWTGRRVETRAFLATLWVGGVLTLILFRLMPAVGPLAYLWRGPMPYMPESALWMAELIPELKLHLIHVVDLATLRGLVSAPSFHTAAAVLYMMMAWPVRRLRWPVIAVNLAMLLSTPVEGTHYLTDMLIGAGVAVTSWHIVAVMVARRRKALAGRLSALAPDWAAPVPAVVPVRSQERGAR